MRVRLLKRGLFWLVQTGLITGLAWYLLQWNYWDRLSDLVPYTIPTFHHLKMLFVAETLITGALASGMALIFAARVEQRPLSYAPGVMLCTWVALWAYVFVAIVGEDGLEVSAVFLGGIGYKFYCLIVAMWVGLVNGMLSLFVGAMNAPPVRRVVFEDAVDRRRVRLVDAVVEVVRIEPPPAKDNKKSKSRRVNRKNPGRDLDKSSEPSS